MTINSDRFKIKAYACKKTPGKLKINSGFRIASTGLKIKWSQNLPIMHYYEGVPKAEVKRRKQDIRELREKEWNTDFYDCDDELICENHGYHKNRVPAYTNKKGPNRNSGPELLSNFL